MDELAGADAAGVADAAGAEDLLSLVDVLDDSLLDEVDPLLDEPPSEDELLLGLVLDEPLRLSVL